VFDVNFLAVALAAATFFVGGLWYGSFAFGPRWGREAGMLAPNEPPREGARCPKHPGGVFAMAYVFSFIGAWTLAWVLGRHPSLAAGAGTGAALGAGVAASSFGVNYQFAARSLVMWAIDGGYHTLQFTLAGLVLALVG